MKKSRIQLVKAHGLTSIYKKKRDPTNRWDVSAFKQGAYVTPDFFEALKKLDKAIVAEGGKFFVTDLRRSWAKQAEARKKYEQGIKKAFVAKPGGSFHNAARAIDISIQELDFPGIPKEDWLEKLWDLAIPLGFQPIIKIPDMRASEAWHFDYPGVDWLDAYEKLSYPQIAKCCILDIGDWDEPNTSDDKKLKMFIQAQIIRLGLYEIGKVDGIIGAKTTAVMKKMRIDPTNLEMAADTLAQRR